MASQHLCRCQKVSQCDHPCPNSDNLPFGSFPSRSRDRSRWEAAAAASPRLAPPAGPATPPAAQPGYRASSWRRAPCASSRMTTRTGRGAGPTGGSSTSWVCVCVCVCVCVGGCQGARQSSGSSPGLSLKRVVKVPQLGGHQSTCTQTKAHSHHCMLMFSI